MSHSLKNPIIAPYIRINPLKYHLWISLRADFYGCKSGEDLPSSTEAAGVASPVAVSVTLAVAVAVVAVVEVMVGVVFVVVVVIWQATVAVAGTIRRNC